MRKFLFLMFATLLFALTPAFAQHGGHASSGHANFGGHAQVHAAPAQHHEVEGARQGHGYNYARGDEHGGARAHWNGGRYEDHFFVSHWGARNPFYWGGCQWYGPRFGIGSYFWFNGGYFVIVDPVPVDWYDEDIYVDYIDGGYYIVSPYHPGIHIAVGIRF